MQKKLFVLGVTLLVALVGADLLVGSRLRGGTFEGAPVPPFGVPDAELRAELTRRAREARERPGRYGPLLGWSARYGWVGVPGTASSDGAVVARNSLGARGAREIDPASPGDRLRVLCFGESFTYGAEVADGEDWPARLESREERLEVSNFGVNAWGTDQALLRFRELAPQLQPDVVLLGLLTENICRNVNRYRQMYAPRDALALVKPRFVLADGRLELVELPWKSEVEFLEVAAHGGLRDELREHEWWVGDDPWPPFSNIARAWAAKRARSRRECVRLWNEPAAEPYRVTLALLEAFHREALAGGARAAAVLVFQPESDHGHYETLDQEPYWHPLLADLEGRGIDAIDTYPTIESLRAGGASGYLGTHHDAGANDAIAARVLEHLRTVLPELR